MDRPQKRTWPWIAATVLFAGGLLFAWRGGGGGPDAALPEEMLSFVDAGFVDAHELVEAQGDEHGSAHEAEPQAARPFFGFCPTDTAPFDRPSFVEQVNLRTAELRDRAQILLRGKRASAELRRGLTSLYSRPPDPEAALVSLEAAPDRRDQGFDLLVAAALHLGVRALNSGRYEDAERWAKRATRADSNDPAPWQLGAAIAERQGQKLARRDRLLQAHKLDPEDPGVALFVGKAFSLTPRLPLAADALDTYLDTYPQDAAVAGLRARLGIRIDLHASSQALFGSGVTLLYPEEVSQDAAREILDTVVDSVQAAATLLGVARREELLVVIYSARADMLAATCLQDWARAAYDGTLHLDGGALMSSPRAFSSHVVHESLHAQLGYVVPRAPYWLHEGLAQHFAEQHSPRHEASYRFMVANHTWVPFSSLNGTFQVIEDQRSALLAYHQSLAMVEYLVHRRGESVFGEAAAFLLEGGDPQLLWDQLSGSADGEALLELLASRLE